MYSHIPNEDIKISFAYLGDSTENLKNNHRETTKNDIYKHFKESFCSELQPLYFLIIQILPFIHQKINEE